MIERDAKIDGHMTLVSELKSGDKINVDGEGLVHEVFDAYSMHLGGDWYRIDFIDGTHTTLRGFDRVFIKGEN